ncbi:hypothetical protein F4809DRAFT_637344 [Biscogniauxia mediterranea]|nr:hypothetical protein F4809DRAFT_637344 [Biscogniauxia mediterranea]
MSTSNSDFDNQVNEAQDTYNRTATTIPVGWIVGIVFIVLSVIISGCYVYNCNSKRRRAREQQLNQKDDEKDDGPTHDNMGLEGGYVQPHPTPIAGPWAQHNEIHGSAIPPRCEVPNTELPYKQTPNSDSSQNSYYDPPRYELGRSDVHRSELRG